MMIKDITALNHALGKMWSVITVIRRDMSEGILKN